MKEGASCYSYVSGEAKGQNWAALRVKAGPSIGSFQVEKNYFNYK